jgi:hypothetical protein
MAVRAAMYHAGARSLSQLLQFPIPAADQISGAFLVSGPFLAVAATEPVFQRVRSKPVLTAVGEVAISRP